MPQNSDEQMSTQYRDREYGPTYKLATESDEVYIVVTKAKIQENSCC